jgi:hypothetical protein
MSARSLLTVSGLGQSSVEVPVRRSAGYVILAHFCDAGDRPTAAGSKDARDRIPVVTTPGERVGDYVLLFASGLEVRCPVRRRFEVGPLTTKWGREPFLARTHFTPVLLDRARPHPPGRWGKAQVGVERVPVAIDDDSPEDGLAAIVDPLGVWSVFALQNPRPDDELVSIRVEASGASRLTIGGLTLFSGRSHPLRYERLQTLAVEGAGSGVLQPSDLGLELGIVARWHRTSDTVAPPPDAPVLVDVMGTRDSLLRVSDSEVALERAYAGEEVKSDDGRWRVRMVSADRTWVRGRIVDSGTGRPMAARLHLRSPEGVYFPPCGHRREINCGWFEDSGSDVQLGATPYAYVDGDFLVELPVGPVHVEVARGFEYRALNETVTVDPGQREIELRLDRVADLRSDGWVTADTHVHFLSPETARLQAEAEAVNVVNLLAAQWGELFTNVGDITGRASGSSSQDTIVWVGTENRQHMLGHISLLGVQGTPVFPLSTAGPDEGWIGEPLVRGLADWADECRAKGGLVISPHFPYPHAEVIADIVLGKVDAIELGDWWMPTLDDFAGREWYRLLNCGYRTPAVGGTDKMSARTPIGGARTYAFIGDRELSFASWAEAVRAGRTFVTTGPLIFLTVDGHGLGEEVSLPPGGGELEIEARVLSTVPVTALELVVNGSVVASEVSAGGTARLEISTRLPIRRSSWIAARCLTPTRRPYSVPVYVAAHTSPVYLTVGNDRPFDDTTGEYLLTLMQGGLEWLDVLATPESPERHRAIAAIFQRGIDEVRSRRR